MDEAARRRDHDRPPAGDDGEAVFFDEAPAGRAGTGEGDAPLDDGEALLADEARPGADEADDELAPDAAAGADLLDRAADAGPDIEPAPAPRPAPAAAPSPANPAVLAAARALLHTAPRHAVGEARASAALPAAALAPAFTRPADAPPGAQLAGQATCPACGARSGWDARACGRCGAGIPPPIPAAGPPLAGLVPLGLPRQQAVEAPPEGDPADLLPPDVRAKVLAARARHAQRTVDITADAARRERVLHAGLGALGLAGGLVLSGMFGLSTALTAGFAALDLALGLGLARWMWRTDVTPIHGMLALPAAALVAFACRSGLVPMTTTVSVAPAMFFLLAFAAGIGRTVATVLADRPSERGF